MSVKIVVSVRRLMTRASGVVPSGARDSYSKGLSRSRYFSPLLSKFA
jgi:hypothetical protein